MNHTKRLLLVAALSALGTLLAITRFRSSRSPLHQFHASVQLPASPRLSEYQHVSTGSRIFHRPQSNDDSNQRWYFHHPRRFLEAQVFPKYQPVSPNGERWIDERSPQNQPRTFYPGDMNMDNMLQQERKAPSSSQVIHIPATPGQVRGERARYPYHENHPIYAPMPVGQESMARKRADREFGAECSSNDGSCAEGFHCCGGVCRAATRALIEFAADDKGELWICGRRARRTDRSTQTASYSGLVPCGMDIYVKAVNSKNEGGAAVGVKVDNGPTYGSGTTLRITSQTEGKDSFGPVGNFKAAEAVWPYTALMATYGAYPVKDAVDSSAGITNFKFQVC